MEVSGKEMAPRESPTPRDPAHSHYPLRRSLWTRTF
jgi:hypothetical protein